MGLKVIFAKRKFETYIEKVWNIYCISCAIKQSFIKLCDCNYVFLEWQKPLNLVPGNQGKVSAIYKEFTDTADYRETDIWITLSGAKTYFKDLFKQTFSL